MSKQRYWITLLGVTAVSTGLTIEAEGQTEPLTLFVSDPRPLAAAVLSLIDRYPISITYEDPRYRFSGDVQDVTGQVRKNLNAPNRVFVPRGGVLEARYEVDSGQLLSAADTIQRIVETKNLNPVGGRFEVYQRGGVFHIVPIEARDSTGAWVRQQSILNAPVTLSTGELNGYELIEMVLKQVGEASGERILGMSAERFANSFFRYRGSIEATNEPARDVLVRALHSINPRFTWLLNYDPSGRYYVFAVALSAEPPPRDIPLDLVRIPRSGEPTPAGPSFRPRND
jgi:hypothetical protein